MVKALLAIGRAVRSAWFVELAGAGLIVAGVATEWGAAQALIVGGSALVLKAYELDLRGSDR